jgi:hypothetical protein
MTAATIMAGLETSQFTHVQDQAKVLVCQNNLRQLGTVLMTMDPLPEAAFYPKDDPKTDPKSLLVLLKDKVSPEMLVCSTAPKALQEKGLTFLWNDKLNGRSLTMTEKTWVMVEMNCLADNPVPPHKGKYHVLYSDGSVKAVDKPPQEILEALGEAKKQKGSPEERKEPATPTVNPPEEPKTPAAPATNLAKDEWATIAQDEAPLYINQVVATKLTRGQKVYITEVRGDWIGVKVNVGGEWKAGWVSKTHVSK